MSRAMNDSLEEWFATEILVHEAALMRYLRRVWPHAADITDLRQDIYVRVYESAQKKRPNMPKAFLFATTRNLLSDRVRRSRIVSIELTQDLEALNVSVDEISPEQRLSARQQLRRLADALDTLSDDCRAVIWLRRIEGLSQREAAERLGMHEGTLESHLCRGVRALANLVLGHDDEVESRRNKDNESQHEQRSN